jgi:hypothetical protein
MKRRCDSWYFSHSFGGEPDLVKVAKQDLDAMQSLGAALVSTDTGNPFKQNFKFLRSGAGNKTTDATAISRVRSTEAARCWHLCDVNGCSGAEISEWPSKDLASHWNWKAAHSVTAGGALRRK